MGRLGHGDKYLQAPAEDAMTLTNFFSYMRRNLDRGTEIDLEALVSTDGGGLVNPCANGTGDDEACGRETSTIYIEGEDDGTSWAHIVIIILAFMAIIVLLVYIWFLKKKNIKGLFSAAVDVQAPDGSSKTDIEMATRLGDSNLLASNLAPKIKQASD